MNKQILKTELTDFHVWAAKNYGRNESKDKPYSKWMSPMLGGEEIRYTVEEVIDDYLKQK